MRLCSVVTPVVDSVVNAPVVAAVAPTVPLILMEAVPVRLVTVPQEGVPSDPPQVTASPAVEASPTLTSLKPPSLILAVGVVCPSLVSAVVKPVARSAVRALKAVDVMVVPVTTG